LLTGARLPFFPQVQASSSTAPCGAIFSSVEQTAGTRATPRQRLSPVTGWNVQGRLALLDE